MINSCNFSGYIMGEPKKISDNLIGVSLLHKKKFNGEEKVTWISITISTKTATWLNGLQKGDYISANNCEFQINEKKYPSFFAFTVESPTLQARGQNQNQPRQEQPQNGNPNNQGGNDFIEGDIPF